MAYAARRVAARSLFSSGARSLTVDAKAVRLSGR